jgi:hypothetical protein
MFTGLPPPVATGNRAVMRCRSNPHNSQRAEINEKNVALTWLIKSACSPLSFSFRTSRSMSRE